jgi:hypothetical protein
MVVLPLPPAAHGKERGREVLTQVKIPHPLNQRIGWLMVSPPAQAPPDPAIAPTHAVQPQAQALRVGHHQLCKQPILLLLEADEAVRHGQRHAHCPERGCHHVARHLQLFVLVDHLAPHVLQGLLCPGDVLCPPVGPHPLAPLDWHGVRGARRPAKARLPALLDVVFLHDVFRAVVEHGDDEWRRGPGLARQAVQGEVELQHAPEPAGVVLALGWVGVGVGWGVGGVGWGGVGWQRVACTNGLGLGWAGCGAVRCSP